ncbi:hypothetical protein LEA_08234, partial [human gut metagenome]
KRNTKNWSERGMNIGMLLLILIGGFAGLFSTLYICISLPFTIIWKIYRRVAKGIPIMK